MISAKAKFYNYHTLGEVDAYGMPQIPKVTDTPKGQIKMSIFHSTLANQDNIKYKDCTYIGLTLAEVKDTFVIDFNGVLLKVLYINPDARVKQVFLKEI